MSCSPRGKRPTRLLSRVACSLALPLLAGAIHAQGRPRPVKTVIQDVQLGLDEAAPRGHLVLDAGRIEAVLDVQAELPQGAHVIEAADWIALPAFVDAYQTSAIETPEPVADQDVPVPYSAGPRIDMRSAGRKGIQPAFRALDGWKLEDAQAEKWREAGFGLLHAAPSGQTLAGQSALVTTRDAALRECVLRPAMFQTAAFTASGRGYPSTLMGFLAQLRQFFLDARWQRDAWQRFQDGKPGERPPYDAELEAAWEILDGQQRVLCAAESSRDIERWIALADEFGFELGIVGGAEAWRVRDLLAARGIPVVMTLNWGDEVDVPEEDAEAEKEASKADSDEETEETEESGEGSEEEGGEQSAAKHDDEDASAEDETPMLEYKEPLRLRRERRRLWEERRDGARLLIEAGVPVAFGSAGESAAELMKRVRTLVKDAELPPGRAVDALCVTPARLFGLDSGYGALAPGRSATLCLWTKSPLEKGAQVAWSFVDGYGQEFEVKEEDESGGEAPDEGLDASGAWVLQITFEGTTQPGRLVLTMEEDGSCEGTLTVRGPDENDRDLEVNGRLSGSGLSVRGNLEMGPMSADLEVKATLEQDELDGAVQIKGDFGEMEGSVRGEREPEQQRQGGQQ